MAVTQYIGARYIPLFYQASDNSNSWEAGVVYEPLVIVTYLNQSYTSKIPVPASVGNPADNPHYWAMTGAYNAQVAQLSQDVQDLDDRLDYRTTVKYVSIGASINLDVNDNLTNGFPDLAFNWLDLDSDDFYNSAISGSGFTTGTKTFEQQLDDAALALDDEFKNSFVRVLVTGGINNDINNGASYLAAVDSFVTKAKTIFPRSSIEFLPLSWSTQQSRRMQIRTFYESYIKHMPEHGMLLWDCCYGYMHNYVDWFRDTIHFSTTGVDAAAHLFIKIIAGADNNINPNEGLLDPLTATGLGTDIDSITWGTIKEYYDGENVTILSGAAIITAGSNGLSFSNNVNSPTILADNPFHYMGSCPYTNGRYYAEMPCTLRGAANLCVDAFAYITTADKLAIYVRAPMSLAANGTANLKFWYIPTRKELC